MEEGIYHEPERAHRDAAVRNVEYRIKEGYVPAAYIGVYEGEIEHVQSSPIRVI